MMRGMAVPTTVWSSELKNIASITPAKVIITCFFGNERNQNGKTGADGGGRPGEKEKRVGPDKYVFSEAEWASKQNTGYASQRSLMKERKKRTGGCKHGHNFMHVVAEVMEERDSVDLTVLQD